MRQEDLEKIIKEVIQSIGAPEEKAQTGKVTAADYPLGEKSRDKLRTPTGKAYDAITLEAVEKGLVAPEDVRIRPETLEMQAQVAESVGRTNFAANLRRAAELIAVPDERILEIYNAIRPYRSTKAELEAIADELENKYGCKVNAALVREAASVYESRGRLKRA